MFPNACEPVDVIMQLENGSQMIISRVPLGGNVVRNHAPMQWGGSFMFEEGEPFQKKQSGRVDDFEGDSTGLLQRVTHVTPGTSQTHLEYSGANQLYLCLPSRLLFLSQRLKDVDYLFLIHCCLLRSLFVSHVWDFFEIW